MPGMQFPYPRKTSNPPYPSSYPSRFSSSFGSRRRQLKALTPYLLGGVALLIILAWLFSANSAPLSTRTVPASRPPPGTPEVVLVTTIDPQTSPSYRENIKQNRLDYAQRHGYATFFPNTTDYDLMADSPSSWSTIPAIRHAMTVFPHTPWFFYLTATALIMDSRESLHSKVLEPRKLESLMIVDTPIVPPDSVIKTYPYLRGERIEFVLTQDKDGLAAGSFLVRSGEWAKFFLDAWYDPLYRSYNFQKAERHALEHLVQWHGTVLTKLALVPQRVLNSYTRGMGGANSDTIYQEGDFVANFHGCHIDPARNCEEEMSPLMSRWRELRDNEKT